MSEHKVEVAWYNTQDDFSYLVYNRTHTWKTEAGVEILASSAIEFLGNPGFINPEDALVASLSSCHMLTFLAIASRKRLVVQSYVDHAVGFLEKNSKGKLAVARVILYPKVVFRETEVTSEILKNIHQLSHEECFIANSVLTVVEIRIS